MQVARQSQTLHDDFDKKHLTIVPPERPKIGGEHFKQSESDNLSEEEADIPDEDA